MLYIFNIKVVFIHHAFSFIKIYGLCEEMHTEVHGFKQACFHILFLYDMQSSFNKTVALIPCDEYV